MGQDSRRRTKAKAAMKKRGAVQKKNFKTQKQKTIFGTDVVDPSANCPACKWKGYAGKHYAHLPTCPHSRAYKKTDGEIR